LAATRDLFAQLGVPWYGVIGNHDYLKATDRRPYEEIFPGRLNYWVEFQGWQIMGLDTTEGLKAAKTKVGEATLRWVDETLPKLDKKHPLMLISHFPLGAGITNRPLNADDLLERFKEYNLQAAFCGHYHAFTERPRGAAMLTTNRCCSLTKFNHDKSKEKGYFLCQAKAGQIQRAFVEVEVPARPAADQGKQT
jgi:hypothetical protein